MRNDSGKVPATAAGESGGDVAARMRRYAGDFELWAAECVKIIDKESGREVPFLLNAPQRRVLATMEKLRRSRKPVRIIMLKARQWGGSTLVQVYMAWMQLVVCRGWNSLTCAHVKDASASIRGMYSRLLRCYPEELRAGKGKDWELTPYEKSASVSYIAARDCQVAIATSMAPNSVRGSNFAMAHLSEVAFWADGDAKAAEEIVRTVGGTVLRTADSIVVMESTANGTDNYFYREWRRAQAGESDKIPVFVPWHEIELYSRPVERGETGRLLASFDAYERELLASGVALESVAWYHDKRREYQSHEAMMAEFPSTPEEAFAGSQGSVFDDAALPAPTPGCGRGATMGVFVPSSGGEHLLSLFDTRGGRLESVADTLLPLPLGKALDEVAKCGVAVMIVECRSADVPSHARWCARAAAERGVRLLYNTDDAPFTHPDADMISEWVDNLLDMLRSGLVGERTEDAVEAYSSFRYASPERTPLILARLAGAFFASRGGCADDYASLL